MRAAIVALAILAGGWAVAADCPTPKRLTCDQLRALTSQRCEPVPPEVRIVEHRVEVPGPTVTVTRDVPVPTPGPERVVTQTTVLPAPALGHWLAGGGPIYSRSLGLTAVGGYQWASGWQILVGPTWVPMDPQSGTASRCLYGASGHGGDDCYRVSVPWAADTKSAWGAQALVVYAF